MHQPIVLSNIYIYMFTGASFDNYYYHAKLQFDFVIKLMCVYV